MLGAGTSASHQGCRLPLASCNPVFILWLLSSEWRVCIWALLLAVGIREQPLGARQHGSTAEPVAAC